MKKSSLILALSISCSLAVSAQKFNRVSAWSNLEKYNSEKDVSYLQKAKDFIDKAVEHPDTKDDAQSWLYRGQIYLTMYQREFNENVNAVKDVTDAGKKQSMAYLTTPIANLITASDAFIKAATLDVKKGISEQVNKGINDSRIYLSNAGNANFNQKKYTEAASFFEKAYAVTVPFNQLDTSNLSNAALSYYLGNSFDQSIQLHKKLIELKYGKGTTWTRLADSYLGIKDSANYKKAIDDGLKLWPQDPDLLTASVNIKMAAGQSVQAIEQLNTLVKQRPNDPTLEFVVGNVYDRMANPTDAKGAPAPKPANYEELIEQAAVHYKKALELDPKMGDACYNLGVLYYNQSLEYYNRSTSSTLTDAAKYNTMWEKPIPEAVKYLEMAKELNPKDLATLNALKACYGHMGNNDKYNELKDEIQKLKQQ